ncbi:PLP-dependent aminotransferase family protein [Sporomusa sphaeroides]|uniref:MocR-like pyridoxine biosynthesis transcription factor PdxR n=1 Tax=Sporomusa sphaeroides TaxID=47679 RepID=UPI002CC8E6DE|nr:PLP-dependent aminotransferase family protein [Sporomusa sphaeroides]HML34999.1 PLP-dependent aminotransferase family protein [Sporomusa sphaeroides]
MLLLDKNSDTPLYMQIYNQFKNRIVSGELGEGNVLPPIRILAKTLLVARNTVESAYQQLCSEGYVEARMGSGYKVQKVEAKNGINLYSNRTDFEQTISQEQAYRQETAHIVRYNFQYGRLDFSNFPLRIWRKLLNQVLLSDDIVRITAYNEKKGDWELRIQIMNYLAESRGVVCKPEQIILCSGAMSALRLVCQLLMQDINIAAVEEPCYDSAREILINHNFQVVPIGLQSDGIHLDQLQNSNAKMLYTTPSHQFPTGIVMPVNKRLKLLEWADTNHTYIIEDDYDSELRYNSRPIPSIYSLDKKDRVIYINSFSKALAPGLRMGFVVLPEELLDKYHANFANYHCSIPWLEQKVMYYFIQQGHWNRLLNKISVSNKRKHDTLINTISEQLGEHVKIYGKNAGLHILLEVKNGMSEKELIESAQKVDVKVYPVSDYWMNVQSYSNNMVLIGYSSLSEEEIVLGIKQLSLAWL